MAGTAFRFLARLGADASCFVELPRFRLEGGTELDPAMGRLTPPPSFFDFEFKAHLEARSGLALFVMKTVMCCRDGSQAKAARVGTTFVSDKISLVTRDNVPDQV